MIPAYFYLVEVKSHRKPSIGERIVRLSGYDHTLAIYVSYPVPRNLKAAPKGSVTIETLKTKRIGKNQGVQIGLVPAMLNVSVDLAEKFALLTVNDIPRATCNNDHCLGAKLLVDRTKTIRV